MFVSLNSNKKGAASGTETANTSAAPSSPLVFGSFDLLLCPTETRTHDLPYSGRAREPLHHRHGSLSTCYVLVTVLRKCIDYTYEPNSYTSILLMKKITNTYNVSLMSHYMYEGKFSGASITIINELLSWSITCAGIDTRKQRDRNNIISWKKLNHYKKANSCKTRVSKKKIPSW